MLVLTEISLRESLGISCLDTKPDFQHNIANLPSKQSVLLSQNIWRLAVTLDQFLAPSCGFSDSSRASWLFVAEVAWPPVAGFFSC